MKKLIEKTKEIMALKERDAQDVMDYLKSIDLSILSNVNSHKPKP